MALVYTEPGAPFPLALALGLPLPLPLALPVDAAPCDAAPPVIAAAPRVTMELLPVPTPFALAVLAMRALRTVHREWSHGRRRPCGGGMLEDGAVDTAHKDMPRA